MKVVARLSSSPNRNTRRESRLPKGLSGTAPFILMFLVALGIVFGLINPRFFATANVMSILSNSASLIIISIGMTYILGAGHLDLSIGGNLVLSSVVAGKVIIALAGSPEEVAAGIYPSEVRAIAIGVAAGILAGAAFGALNGLLVTNLKIHSFIVTLGTNGIAIGAYNLLTGGSNINFLPSSLQRQFGSNRALDIIPYPLILALTIALVAWIWLNKTAFGRHTIAAGSSELGAIRSGVNTKGITVRVFIISGFLAGVAGVLDLTKFGTTALAGHDTDILQALSAAIIGGASLNGGRASIGGTVSAAFIPTMLLSGFIMVGIRPFYQYIAVGCVLIIAVYLDRIRRERELQGALD